MISLWAQQEGAAWYGVAEHDGMLVATVAARTRGEACRLLQGCIPPAAPFQLVEQASDFQSATVLMLARLEAGNEEDTRFTLSPTYVPEPKAGILRAAAAIPLGFVSTYGAIAAAAETNARVVGRIMATNPLYPIVPCHRVVGSDMALVGYGGRQTPGALAAKLGRLRAEARGFTEERTLPAMKGMRVMPVEWVLAKAAREEAPDAPQLTLW